MNIILPISQKGGVGKTCLSFLATAYLAHSKKSFAVLDLDPIGQLFSAYQNAGNAYSLNCEHSQSIVRLDKGLAKIRNKFDYLVVNIPGGFLEIFRQNVAPALFGSLLNTNNRLYLFYIRCPDVDDALWLNSWMTTVRAINYKVFEVFPRWLWVQSFNSISNLMADSGTIILPEYNGDLIRLFYSQRIPLEAIPIENYMLYYELYLQTPWVILDDVFKDN